MLFFMVLIIMNFLCRQYLSGQTHLGHSSYGGFSREVPDDNLWECIWTLFTIKLLMPHLCLGHSLQMSQWSLLSLGHGASE